MTTLRLVLLSDTHGRHDSIDVPAIREKWDRIPAGTDVLVTHGPPLGHGDQTFGGERVGCADLLDAVERVAPRLHVFGHIHEGAGRTTNGVTDFVNACVLDSGLRPSGAAEIYDIEV